MVAREGIEPPTRGFSARCRGFRGFINLSLAASCRPLPRHTKAQSWHSQSELVTFLARDKRNSYSGQWRSPLTGDESVRAADRLSLNLLGSPPSSAPVSGRFQRYQADFSIAYAGVEFSSPMNVPVIIFRLWQPASDGVSEAFGRQRLYLRGVFQAVPNRQAPANLCARFHTSHHWRSDAPEFDKSRASAS
jgi:hypothetical protein